MSKLTKEEFVKKMLANEQFKKAEKRRKVIWENKKEMYEYMDFSSNCKFREQRKKR